MSSDPRTSTYRAPRAPREGGRSTRAEARTPARPAVRNASSARSGSAPRSGSARAPRPAQGRPANGRGRTAPARRAPRRRGLLRRPLVWLALALVAVGVGVVAVSPPFLTSAVKEITLPLRHEDIIRQQADDKGLDPALVAGVIYTESRFRDNQESSAGAMGLMQITPATASDVARQSGGSAFTTGDLHTAQVNISYGTYRLRYLLQQFGGNTTEALAAYNAGEGNVRKWIGQARAEGVSFTRSRIPYAETREYVGKVLDARRDYARTYPDQLGLR